MQFLQATADSRTWPAAAAEAPHKPSGHRNHYCCYSYCPCPPFLDNASPIPNDHMKTVKKSIKLSNALSGESTRGEKISLGSRGNNLAWSVDTNWKNLCTVSWLSALRTSKVSKEPYTVDHEFTCFAKIPQCSRSSRD